VSRYTERYPRTQAVEDCLVLLVTPTGSCERLKVLLESASASTLTDSDLDSFQQRVVPLSGSKRPGVVAKPP
jgi:hypothetical protein